MPRTAQRRTTLDQHAAGLPSRVRNDNQLTGTIPAELGSLTNLTSLGLRDNQLTGTIPAELGSLTNLTRLTLNDNQLTGTIPAELARLSNLTDLGLSYNQLTGTIPAELGSLTNLTRLTLNDNQLTGTIPAELGSLTKLTSLYLGDNQLTGTIPAELASLINLEDLWLDNDTGLCLASDFPLDSTFARLAQEGGVSVCSSDALGFTDDPLEAGVTRVKAVHFAELRERIDGLRAAREVDPFPWTDPTVTAGLTPVKAVHHVSELRAALEQAYVVAGRASGFNTQPARTGGVIRAADINELRRAIEALESEP